MTTNNPLDNKEIIVYSKDNCPWCERAKTILDNLGYSYKVKQYGVDFTREDLVELLGDGVRPTVPQIFAGEVRIGTYEDLRKSLGLE